MNQLEMKTGIIQSNKRFAFEDSNYLSEVPNNLGCFCSTSDPEKILAKRVKVELTKSTDIVYVNDELLYAVDWLASPHFKIVLYNEDDDIMPDRYYGAQLYSDAKAIVFDAVPSQTPKYVSFVKWCGNIVGELALRTDGSNQMAEDYTPADNQDVATKKYVDDALSFGAKARNLIEDSTVSVTQLEATKTLKLINGKFEEANPTVFIGTPNKWVFTTSPIIIQTKTPELFHLCLYIDGTRYGTSDSLKDLDEARANGAASGDCYISDEIDIYKGMPFGEGIFIAKTYKFLVKSSIIDESLAGIHRAEVKLYKKTNGVWVEQIGKVSKPCDFYAIKPLSFGLGAEDVRLAPKSLSEYHTKKISGKMVVEAESGILHVDAAIGSRPYSGYLPFERVATLKVDDKEIDIPASDLTLGINEFRLSKDVAINFRAIKERDPMAEASQIKTSLVIYGYYGLPIKTIESLVYASIDFESKEPNRVTTPNAQVEYPEENYGRAFDRPGEFDMIQHNGIYSANNDKSALMIVVNSEEKSFSHVIIEHEGLEGDGAIQVCVDGDTQWISANDEYKLAQDPTKNGDGGLVSKNSNSNRIYVTMGKKCYKNRAFIRLIGFSKVSHLNAYVE